MQKLPACKFWQPPVSPDLLTSLLINSVDLEMVNALWCARPRHIFSLFPVTAAGGLTRGRALDCYRHVVGIFIPDKDISAVLQRGDSLGCLSRFCIRLDD